MSSFPGQPPADASGGFFVIKYSNGTTGTTHKMRAHVEPFLTINATNGLNGTYATGGTGTEPDVITTATAFMTQVKSQLNAAWTLTLDSIWQLVGGVLSEQFGWTPPAAVAGTNASADSTIPGSYYMFGFRTTHGGKYRLIVLNPGGWTEFAPVTIAANAGGNASQAMVAYLTGVATRICGHDGYPLVAPAHQVVGVNRRLRRKAGWA